ncbi:hypothetical protein I350_06576 [Cryptococcus amylolentus CBS 6273]|uniref:Velvet domain-containing protein n=1 Tax=Cryptococcus amylolentus CBS 6273 TaxID=1296118 RepID=A0A1E3JNP6_9TREE|nr:hypothetical protein I350_06576 [Cryptococcus amylolentus CBS 6273]
MSPSLPRPPLLSPPSRAAFETAKSCADVELATDHQCVLSTYELIIRQQPMQARMCGVGDKSDRRPVDPTPIIQLKIIDQHGSDITPTDPRHNILRRPEPGPDGMTFMQNPYYFLFACLVGGEEQEDELHVIDDGKTRFLTGTPVSSLYHLKDLDNTDAAFFVFPDLGVRKEGRYKLKLTLFEIVDQEVYYCTTMFTSTFSVYSAKKFPGMSTEATDLSMSFAEQGLKIRVRKDPRQPAKTGPPTGKSKRKSSAADSEEDDALPPPPQVQSSKRSRGSSDYPPHAHHVPPHHVHPQAESRLHPPPPPPDAYYPYPPPSHTHPYGYPPPGHAMPPPPPPSAYEPYRRQSMQSPAGYHPGLPHPSQHGYPAGYYGGSAGGRGRPATHPVPGPGRHHQSMPPHPGYMQDSRDPRDPRDPRSALPSPSSHGHTYPPPSAGGYSPFPGAGDYERSGVPWPQGPAPGERERERRGLPRPEELESSRPGSRGHSSHAPSGSRHHPYGHPSSSRQPLSPRSRTSPSRPVLVTSPERGFLRPPSASRESSLGLPPAPPSAGGGRERRGSPLMLPPLTRSPGSIGGSLSLGAAGALVSESNERGSISEPSGRGKEGERPDSSAGKNKMGLGNLLG